MTLGPVRCPRCQWPPGAGALQCAEAEWPESSDGVDVPAGAPGWGDRPQAGPPLASGQQIQSFSSCLRGTLESILEAPGSDPEIPDARASGFIFPIPAKSGFPISRIRDSGQIGIPDFPNPGIPAESGSGQNPEYFPDPGPIGIGKIPAIFPAKSGRGGIGIGDFGVCPG